MRSLWALICHTLLMSLRRPAALGFVLAVAVFGPLLGLYVESDGTLPGVLKLIMTYSFGITSTLLMFLLMYLSATVLDDEISGKQIFLLDVKPVPRWKVLLGKWLGLMGLSGLLLMIMGAQTYAVIWLVTRLSAAQSAAMAPVLAGAWALILAGVLVYHVRLRYWRRRWLAVTLLVVWLVANTAWPVGRIQQARIDSGPGRDAASVQEAFQQLLVSRRSVTPDLPDVEAEVEAYKDWLAKQQKIDEDAWRPEQLRAHLEQIVSRRTMGIEFEEYRDFRFHGLPTGDSLAAGLTIRHHLYGSRGSESAGWIDTGWAFFNPDTGQGFGPRMVESRAGSTREFTVPGSAVSEKGELIVRVVNMTGPGEGEGDNAKPPARIAVSLDNGIEILVPYGRFEFNYLRGVLLLWIRLAMVAAVGLCASTFVRGSIAAFLVFGLIVAGTLNGFVMSSVKPADSMGAIMQTAERQRPLGSQMLVGVLDLLPDFDDTDPVQDLVIGREIPPGRLAVQAAGDLGLRAGLFVILGLYAYYRREVGLPRQ